jgi:hypothetical protein
VGSDEWAAPGPLPLPGQSHARDVAGLLLAGEHALTEDGDLVSARAAFTQAAEQSLSSGPPEALARAAIGLGGLWVHEHRTAAAASKVAALQQRALAQLEPHTTLAARLRMRLAAETDYRRGTCAAVLAALSSVRATDDSVALAEALSLAHHCALAPDHADLRLQLADELLGLAGITNRRVDVILGLTWRTIDLFLSGDHHAERSLHELQEAITDRPFHAVEFVVQAIKVMLTIRAGDLAAAEEQAAACAQRGYAAGDADAAGWHAAQIVAIRWFQGRLGDLAPSLREIVHTPTLACPDDSMLAAFAVSAAQNGNREAALSALHRLRGEGLALLTPSSTWLVTLIGAAEAAFLLGDADIAAEVYQLLRPYAGLPVMASLAIVCFGSAHQALGTAALAMGDLDRASRHLTAAVTDNERLGNEPALAFSRLMLAKVAALPDAPRPRPAATCQKDGSGWRIKTLSSTAVVADSVGMRYLAFLIEHPGQEIPAAQLAGASNRGMSAEPVLDDAARAAYRRRAKELQDQLDDAHQVGDADSEERITAEMDWLLAEIQRTTGLGGRPRRFADDSERARTAVRKAVRRALDRIRQTDEMLGAELEADVVTGASCCYQRR